MYILQKKDKPCTAVQSIGPQTKLIRRLLLALAYLAGIRSLVKKLLNRKHESERGLRIYLAGNHSLVKRLLRSQALPIFNLRNQKDRFVD